MTADPPRDDTDDELDPAEDAFNWDTGRDASHVEGPKPLRSTPMAPPRAPATGTASAVEGRAGTSSFLLVTYGIMAGAFLLYAIGWFTSVRRNSYVDPNVLGEFMSVLGDVLAVAAAPVWFGAVFVLTRNSKPIVRLLLLLLGLLLLVPVPFVLGM